MLNTNRLMVVGALVLLSNMATAETYTYTGVPYTTVTGGYTTAMRITGSFDTASPLPANMPMTPIGPNGLNLAITWSFNDGVNSLNSASSVEANGDANSFAVATDASGQIIDYSIGLMTPYPPNTVNQLLDGMYISPSLYQGITGANCNQVTNDVCTLLLIDTDNYGFGTTSGTWAGGSAPAPTPPAAATPVPVMSVYGLGMTIFGLFVLAASRIPRRRS